MRSEDPVGQLLNLPTSRGRLVTCRFRVPQFSDERIDLTPFYANSGVTLYLGDALECLRQLPDESVNCCITSPPYWGLRDYGVPGQIGLEATPDEYVARMVEVFAEVRRVLRSDGVCWINLGDSYTSGGRHGHGTRLGFKQSTNRGANDDTSCQRCDTPPGLKPKDLCGIPWRVAFALQTDGWWLRSDIIWAKPAPMPESVTDRLTRSHEYIFLLAKSERYFYDADAIREPLAEDSIPRAMRSRSGGKFNGRPHSEISPLAQGAGYGGANVDRVCPPNGRNKRDVWTVNTDPFPEAHFATFPPALILPCVLAGCPVGGTILDPFSGAGTTALVAKQNGRHCIGLELNEDYLAMSAKRLSQEVFEFQESVNG